jgi:putative ABC transport system permease protein
VYGLRARPLRVALSALGIAIGITAMVAVVGVSASSREGLRRALDALGTNLLTVQPGRSLTGEQATLPDQALPMIRRIDDVQSASAIGELPDARVYRHYKIPAGHTGGIGVYAAQLDLPETISAEIDAGAWLNAATADYPTVVLGSKAADRLGVGDVGQAPQIWLGGRWFTVVGVLKPITLVPSLDLSALIGWPAAERYLARSGEVDITTAYVRANPDAVDSARTLLAQTANPEKPNEVDISRPSDALAARAAANVAFTGLLLGLGAVALLVGGVGVVNTMVIAVLERRAEIGLRRSQGATRQHIGIQFLSEAVLLSALGGGAGDLVGSMVTEIYALSQGWPVAVPIWALLAGVGATLTMGALAGLYPAIRAARLAPTEALAAG